MQPVLDAINRLEALDMLGRSVARSPNDSSGGVDSFRSYEGPDCANKRLECIANMRRIVEHTPKAELHVHA